ncbi:MAG: NUDIX hydrolase [Bacteroides sp.]|nr:NUDIX hydrolase [Eubacterium sp.]MCM1418821.1 NUDIX hydrolase [Roseburia sp.]MCM1462095.1 NUDIX hydrolase [Bacteroides sp.]
MHLNEETVDSKLSYQGKIFEVYSDTALLENGMTTPRDVIRHPGGVCIVALSDKNEVFFVRQFRYPHKKVLLEIPAGKLEWGEEPLDCGKRELREETGFTAERFRSLGRLLPTPAYDTEIIYMYLAEGLRRAEQNLDDNEFLDVLTIPLDQAVKMVLENEIDDAKTQLALLKTAVLLG